MRLKRALALLAAVGLGTAAGAQPAAPDWSTILRSDAQALHDLYARDHPGSVDPLNPSFRTRLREGLSLAQRRARAASSYGAYWWAMRDYVASFNDGHVFIDANEGSPRLPLRWPGFLTREVDGQHLVATRVEGARVPALGSRLISCDGVAAADLARGLVGRFRGRWNLASQHEAHGWRLFLDASNPYVRRPARCIFREGTRDRSFELAWRDLPQEALDERLPSLTPRGPGRIELRPFGERGLWLSLSSFTSDRSTDAHRKLEAALADLAADPARLARTETIILDVRGNGGGSSTWGDRIAATIWGEQNARAAKSSSAAVDWRASDANIAGIEASGARSGGVLQVWAAHIAAGMRQALQKGEALWRETPVLAGFPPAAGGNTTPRIDPGRSPSRAKVYILTDAGCASACLDAMDVWTRLGAVQVGRETSADSLYMEIRRQGLPSGLATVSVPMKVYRGRPRAANQPYRPVHVFSGDMGAQPAVETWIASLPR